MDNNKITDNQIKIDDTLYITNLTKKYSNRKKWVPENPSILKAFIPGTIREIYVETGSIIKKGDKLLILEAMKMKNTIYSPVNGKVKSIIAKTGNIVMKNQTIMEFELS